MKKKLLYIWLGVIAVSLFISLAPEGLDGNLFGVLPLIFILFLLTPFISGILLILIQTKNRSYEFLPIFLVGASLNNISAVVVVSLIEFSRSGYFLENQLFRPAFNPLNLFGLFSFFMAISIFGGLIGLVIRGITLLINKKYEKE